MLNRMLNHPNHYQTMATVTLDRVQPVYEPQLSRHTDAMQLVSERKQKKLTSKQAQLAGHLKNMRHRLFLFCFFVLCAFVLVSFVQRQN